MRAAAVRLREPGTVKAPAITGNGMAFARLPSKKGAMKHTDRTGAEQTAARQPEPTQEITVTQVTPDDILNDVSKFLQRDGQFSREFHIWIEKSEIVGNIHDNPELLGGD